MPRDVSVTVHKAGPTLFLGRRCGAAVVCWTCDQEVAGSISGSGSNCVTTVGKSLTPSCLDADSLRYYMELYTVPRKDLVVLIYGFYFTGVSFVLSLTPVLWRTFGLLNSTCQSRLHLLRGTWPCRFELSSLHDICPWVIGLGTRQTDRRTNNVLQHIM